MSCVCILCLGINLANLSQVFEVHLRLYVRTLNQTTCLNLLKICFVFDGSCGKDGLLASIFVSIFLTIASFIPGRTGKLR